MSEKQRLRRAETVRALERMGAHAENYCIHLDDHQQSDWAAGIESVEFFIGGMESELARLRGVVEALAATDPVDTSFTFPRCWHCGGESPNEHATAEHWLEHEDDCIWAAAVAALEGETP